MGKEWITIAEAAQLAGISTQAIYKRLNTTLNQYYKVIDGKKMLHINAIKEMTDNPDSKQSTNKPVDGDLTTILQNTINVLTEQLAVKDEQIIQLNNRLEQALNVTGQQNYILAQKQLSDPEPASDQTEPRLPWYKRIFK